MTIGLNSNGEPLTSAITTAQHALINHTGVPGVGDSVGGTGVDGALTVLTGTVVEITGPKNYTTLTIQGTGILTTVAGRALVVRAQTCDIQGTGKISGTGRSLPAAAGGGTGGTGPATNPTIGTTPAQHVLGPITATTGGGGGGQGGYINGGNGAAGGNGVNRQARITGGASTGGAGGSGAHVGIGNPGLQAPAVGPVVDPVKSFLIELMKYSAMSTIGPAGWSVTTFQSGTALDRSLGLDLAQSFGDDFFAGGSSGPGGAGGGFPGVNVPATYTAGGAGGTPGSQTGSNFGVGGNGASTGPAHNPGGGGGGAGGAGGAPVFCEFDAITMAVGARIESHGSAGGNGGSTTGDDPAPNTTNGGGGGGGSGGAAGPVLVLYRTGTNVDTVRVVAVGGLGGTGGVGTLGNPFTTNQGGVGGAGRPGEDGYVAILQIT